MKKIITACTLALSLLGTIGANEAYAATTNCPKQATTIQFDTKGCQDIQSSINAIIEKNCNSDIKSVSDTLNKKLANKTVAKKSNKCVKVKGVKSNCKKINIAKKCSAITK